MSRDRVCDIDAREHLTIAGRGGGFGGTERFPLALHRGFPAVKREHYVELHCHSAYSFLAGRGGEGMQVLGLAAGGARAELWEDPGGEQQLQAEGQAVGRPGVRAVGFEQRQLVLEQAKHLRVWVGRFEQAGDGVTGARGRVERLGVVAQPGMDGHGVGARDGDQLASSLVEHHADVEERLQPGSEAASRPPYPLGDGA